MSMKEAYQNKLQSQLDKCNAEISQLKAKADKAGADVKLEYHKQIQDIKIKQDAAKQKLVELGNAKDDAWEDIKAGADNAWHALGDAVEKATARFK